MKEILTRLFKNKANTHNKNAVQDKEIPSSLIGAADYVAWEKEHIFNKPRTLSEMEAERKKYDNPE